MEQRDLLSVVIPVLDELPNVEPIFDRLSAVAAGLPDLDFEIIFVDDGSRDGTRELLRRLAGEHPSVRSIEMSRNFGHQLAITAGIDHASGDAVVIMDGDLQDPPEVIPLLVESWRRGNDVVYAVRGARLGESRIKTVAASIHYRLLRWLSDTEIPVDTGDFRLISERVARHLIGMRESSRYIRGMVAWLGYCQDSVVFQRAPRAAGEPKYNYRKLLRLSVDGIASFTERPLTLTFQLGGLVMLIAIGYGLFVLIAKLLNPSQANQGFASIIIAVLFLGGLQLFAIGLVGQYVGRIFKQSKGRPLYVISDIVGFPKDNSLAGRTPRMKRSASTQTDDE